MTKIIAIAVCPSGVAHTCMATEALGSAARAKGWQVKVETRGSIGLESRLTAADVTEADIVILTKDTDIKSEEHFTGKTIVRVNINDAVKRADAITNKIGAHLTQTTWPLICQMAASPYLTYRCIGLMSVAPSGSYSRRSSSW